MKWALLLEVLLAESKRRRYDSVRGTRTLTGLHGTEPQRHITLRYGVYRMYQVRDMIPKCGYKNWDETQWWKKKNQSAAKHYRRRSDHKDGLIVFNECDWWFVWMSADAWSTGGVCGRSYRDASLVIIPVTPPLNVCLINSLLITWAPAAICLAQCKYEGCYSSADLTADWRGVFFFLLSVVLRFCLFWYFPLLD